jgi:DNA-binding CsgD family transcriptional regulator/tetratricopeptide (TPR) repeat protein
VTLSAGGWEELMMLDVGISPPVAPQQGVPEPLVGRDREVALLRAFLAGAATDGGCLILCGEPGVGKSALLAAATHEARSAGSRVLQAAGAEFEADLSFSALNQLLVPLHREFGQLAEEHRRALSVALGLRDDSPADRMVVSTAVLLLLREVAEARPLILVVDDLPWLDRSSATVLRFVARRLSGTRVAFLATARTGEDDVFEVAGLPGIDVGPLDDEAAATLLAQRSPGLTARTRRQILAQAQGNPLALMELPVEATSRPGTRSPGGRLRAHFTARVQQLPAPIRRLLLFAALYGSGDVRVLRAAGVGPDGIDELAAAQRAGLVTLDAAGRFDFRHPLTRSAVVDASTGAQRREAHRALAEQLADQPERQAWHLAEAVVEPDEKVAGLLEHAGRTALRRGDAVGAVAALIRAADLSPGGADRSRRLAQAAYVGADVAGGLRQIPRLLVDARQADPDTVGSLHAAVTASFMLFNGEGDVDTAHRLLVDAIETRTQQYEAEDSTLGEALFTLMLVCFFGGRPELWAPFDAAISRLGSRAPEVLSLCSRTYADPVHADPRTLDRLASAITGLHDDVDPTRIVRLGIASFWIDRLSGCRDALWRVVHDGRHGGAVASAIQALLLLGFDDFMTGQWDQAQQLFQESIDLSDTHGYGLRSVSGWYGHALLTAVRGDDRTTIALTDKMTRWAALRGVRAATHYARHARTLAAIGRGDFEDAYQQAAAISPPGTLPSHVAPALWVVMDLVEAAVRTNHRDEATAHVAAVRDAGVAAISPRLALLAAGSAAIAAPHSRAGDCFDEALAIPGIDRWPFDTARVQLAYGERLRRCGAMSASRIHLSAAHDTFVELGAHPWTTRASDELRATGQHRRRPVKPTTSPSPLTPQQQQIAALAASGLTNKQIAERLFLSHRTVSDHLYRIFPRLGVTSRAALRDALEVLPAEEPHRASHT